MSQQQQPQQLSYVCVQNFVVCDVNTGVAYPLTLTDAKLPDAPACKLCRGLYHNETRCIRWRRVLCRSWAADGKCPYGSLCSYAHGYENYNAYYGDRQGGFKSTPVEEMICHSCKTYGHKAAVCPFIERTKCWNCNEDGHKMRDCPNVQCHECGNSGHYGSDCPYMAGSSVHLAKSAATK